MNELVFDVVFLSDIVLPASSNTEGNIEQLDFIPGSNFLGMAARKYDDFDDTFNVFHSGKVRFGDATLLKNEEETYKMPLSFFHEKLNDTLFVNHHHIEDFTQFKQLKQKRKGYITKDLEEISIKYNYAQKSAYDKTKRRSKEGSMYGYHSLPAGSVWQFVVKIDEQISASDIEKIEAALTGKKRLGKSKSSQYGSVSITKSKKAASVECVPPNTEEVVLYAKSRVALVDDSGQPTYDLRYLFNDKAVEIVWEKSQIRTSLFAPYNGAMQTKAYERLVINSGSVIVVKNVSSEALHSLKDGVGVYLSEGFGEVLVNPQFLQNKEMFALHKKKPSNPKSGKELTFTVSQFLGQKQERKKAELSLAFDVVSFISRHKDLYKNIKNAQWGSIRSICTSSVTDFRNEIRDYISSGKVTWTTEQIETLLQEERSRDFIKLLSMQMPKEKGDK